MGFMLNARSEKNLVNVHADLVRVVRDAAKNSNLEFVVIEGVRTKARQKQLVEAGASKTMNSRHLTGHAVDLAAMVSGKIRWDWPLYTEIANVMKKSAQKMGVTIVWGGDWISFKDGPHFELNRKFYP